MFARLRQLFRTSALRLALRYALLNVAVLAAALAVLFVLVNRYVDQQIASTLTAELAALTSLPDKHRLDSVRVLSGFRSEERQLRYYRLENAAGQMIAGNIEAWPSTLPVDGVVRVTALKVAQRGHDNEADTGLSAVATQLPEGARLLVAQAPGALEDLREIALSLAAAVLGLAALLSLALGMSLGWQWISVSTRSTAPREKSPQGTLGSVSRRAAVVMNLICWPVTSTAC